VSRKECRDRDQCRRGLQREQRDRFNEKIVNLSCVIEATQCRVAINKESPAAPPCSCTPRPRRFLLFRENEARALGWGERRPQHTSGGSNRRRDLQALPLSISDNICSMSDVGVLRAAKRVSGSDSAFGGETNCSMARRTHSPFDTRLRWAAFASFLFRLSGIST
jgi:hypothetical protein